MSATIKGTAVVWGVGGVTFTAGITSTSMVQSLTFERASELAEIKDTTGEIKTMIFHGGIKKLNVTVVPTGSSIANAVTAKEAYLPAPGTLITVADASQNAPEGENLIEQNWIAVSATENRTVDGVVTIDLELENYDTDISATAS